MSTTEPRTQKTENLRIFLTGVGGQGTLLASRLLGEAALAAGLTPGERDPRHGPAGRHRGAPPWCWGTLKAP